MQICDRCGKKAKRLTELKDEYGGSFVCDSCENIVYEAFRDFTSLYITPLFEKRTEYVRRIAQGFILVD